MFEEMNYTQDLEDLEIDFKVLTKDRPTKNTTSIAVEHLQLPDLLAADVLPKQLAPEPNIPPDLIILEPEIFEQLQAEPLAQPQNLRRSQREKICNFIRLYSIFTGSRGEWWG